MDVLVATKDWVLETWDYLGPEIQLAIVAAALVLVAWAC